MREVIHYDRKEQNLTACRLCPKLCTIREGKYGFCRVRQNRGGDPLRHQLRQGILLGPGSH